MDAVEGFLAEEQDWATFRAVSPLATGPTFPEAWTTCVTSDVANAAIWTSRGMSELQECKYTHFILVWDYKEWVAIFPLVLWT